MDWQERTRQLIGDEKVSFLGEKSVLVVGLGGVGGSCAEALVRSGIGTLGVIDKDVIELSNLNRQIIATNETIGISKISAFKERALKINPDLKVLCYDGFYQEMENRKELLLEYDYIVDAIDDKVGKIALIKEAKEAAIPIVSAMGMGNRVDPMKLCEGDIYETQSCPLAKAIRKSLRDLSILSLKVVYSKEESVKIHPPGTMTFVPNSCGLALASIVVRDLLKEIV